MSKKVGFFRWLWLTTARHTLFLTISFTRTISLTKTIGQCLNKPWGNDRFIISRHYNRHCSDSIQSWRPISYKIVIMTLYNKEMDPAGVEVEVEVEVVNHQNQNQNHAVQHQVGAL
ncbi:unnamed protein product [Lactuca saligna]|uniref:Uncharacterized protein n=1 Tax=Lactuca saligna TaxID=75948 RepID=A0AA35Y698_LACSI|nr:unnamed protein product [Lactuca saligna]